MRIICPGRCADGRSIEPWVEAVTKLSDDDVAHSEESERSLAVARKFTGALRVDAFEEYLATLKPRLTDEQQRALLMKRLAR